MTLPILKIYKVSTAKNYVWVAAPNEKKAREYGFNTLDDAWLPETLRVVLHSEEAPGIKSPGVVPHDRIVSLLTPKSGNSTRRALTPA